MRNEHFFIVIYHSSLVKGAMNAARLCKLRNGDGQILLKPRRDDSFNKDLSNEPNFGRIHLAGQYL
jgi:hypothetical protein